VKRLETTAAVTSVFVPEVTMPEMSIAAIVNAEQARALAPRHRLTVPTTTEWGTRPPLSWKQMIGSNCRRRLFPDGLD